jgi:hypothetical protein
MNAINSIRSFSADTETELWDQISADMLRDGSMLEYAAQLNQGGYQFMLDIDIDPGGGFEGGYATTTLAALVPGAPALRFSLVEQDLVHELGKLLGLKDVELGYPALDAAFIIRTNEPGTLRTLLADEAVQTTLLKYRELRLTLAPASEAPETTEAPAEAVYLVFSKEAGIVDPAQLREIYQLLLSLLRQLAPLP